MTVSELFVNAGIWANQRIVVIDSDSFHNCYDANEVMNHAFYKGIASNVTARYPSINKMQVNSFGVMEDRLVIEVLY